MIRRYLHARRDILLTPRAEKLYLAQIQRNRLRRKCNTADSVEDFKPEILETSQLLAPWLEILCAIGNVVRNVRSEVVFEN